MKYRVTIELQTTEFIISANSIKEAKQKALERLNRNVASSYIEKNNEYRFTKPVDVEKIENE